MAALTVSKPVVPEVEACIARQKEHDKQQDVEAGFLEFLRRHGIEHGENDVFP